jgi:S-(hydroxymethyl)glutathione dehydrogenase/alcohol dehydrogenase
VSIGARAAVFDGTDLVVDDVELDPPGPAQVLVRILASGICHSDLNVVDGTSPVPPPVVLGHEGAGVVEAVGAGVEGWEPGAPVLLHTLTPCGRCRHCRAGRPTSCPEAYGSDARPFTWRGQPARSYANVSSFAQRTVVRADQLVAAAGLDPTRACLVGCAVTTGWGVVHNAAGVVAGDRVAVLGVGGIGANAVQAAHHVGAEVVAVDVDERRREVALRFGADRFETPATVVGPFDVVVECSGAPSAIDAAIELTGPGGTTALVGLPAAGHRASFDVGRLMRGRRIVGSLNGDLEPGRDLPRILDQVRAGELDLDGLVGATWPLDAVAEAVTAVRRGEVVRAVLDMA